MTEHDEDRVQYKWQVKAIDPSSEAEHSASQREAIVKALKELRSSSTSPSRSAELARKVREWSRQTHKAHTAVVKAAPSTEAVRKYLYTVPDHLGALDVVRSSSTELSDILYSRALMESVHMLSRDLERIRETRRGARELGELIKRARRHSSERASEP